MATAPETPTDMDDLPINPDLLEGSRRHMPETEDKHEEEDEEEQDQVATYSPDVDLPNLEQDEQAVENDEVALALGTVDHYIEQVAVEPMGTDGDKSEHFTKSQAKGKKACKQANRTPEAEGKNVDKSGNNQRKQLTAIYFTGQQPNGL
ncbi:unnamed protein product [Calypogeia fissa]